MCVTPSGFNHSWSSCRTRWAQPAEREGEKRYRRIVEMPNEGIWTLDALGCTTFVNRQFAYMLGYEPKEMAGKKVLDFCPKLALLPFLKLAGASFVCARKTAKRRGQRYRRPQFRMKSMQPMAGWSCLPTSRRAKGRKN